MSEFFTISVLATVLASGIRLATPYLLAALGEAIGQRSGVLNLGVDGIMLLAAFGAYYTALKTNNLWLAVLVALLIGLAMGAVYGLITVRLHAAQGISGIGIFLFGLGFSDLLFQAKVGTPLPIPHKLPRLGVPILTRIPHLGDALFRHNLMTYAAFLMVPAVAFVLKNTTFGMNVRAVGENPQAADSLGVSVGLTRFFAILLGSSAAGLAGAALVLQGGIFQANLTNGLGFIAIAIVYFGAWRPVGVMAGSLLFGLVNATVIQLKVQGAIPRSASDLASMAPAIVTILALVFLADRVKAPAALTKPFTRH